MSAPAVHDPERRFLFLQGLASPFFKRLAAALRAKGYATRKIHLCLGDTLFWDGSDAVSYRGRFSRWPDYLRAFIQREGITDLVLFGDRRPYHRAALDVARGLGLKLHVFEEGYLRPNWLTLEHGSVNADSGIPRDPRAITAMAVHIPAFDTAEPIQSHFVSRAVWDISANVATLAGIGLYPFFRHHRPLNPVLEYMAWIPRLVLRSGRELQAHEAIENLIAQDNPKLFLLPLQLDSDYQIRSHSPFRNMAAVMEHVIASFASHAPGDARLVVKVHPLDNGIVNHARNLRTLAARFGVQDRITCIDGGNLGRILHHVSGVVVVNSTVGLQALRDKRAVKVLGTALYDIEGLTAQDSLDVFWSNPVAPDRSLFKNFQSILMACTQVNGGFYDDAAIAIGVHNAVARMEEYRLCAPVTLKASA